MSINVNLNDMENLKEDLMSFKKWLFFETLIEIPVEQIDKYIDTLNLRPREPRAVNRNEQAKESCPHFVKCLNGGKNKYCDLQTLKEIDCYVGQDD